MLAEAHFREPTKGIDTVTAWHTVEGDLARVLAAQARFTDLLLLGQYDTENPPTISAFLLPEKVVVDAGTPIVVVPTHGTFDHIGRHILVSWDGSREAARALRDAMPLLQAAEQVSLLAVDPDRQGHVHPEANAAEVAAHLALHGVPTGPTELPSGANSVTDILLAQLSKLGADLVVMGAYGHPRVLEFILGGTTQDFLGRVTVPVLMSH